MRRSTILLVAAALTLGGALGAIGLLAGHVLKPGSAAAPSSNPVWTEVPWPFPMDQWGKGKAFQCKAEHCDAEVELYLRAPSSAPALARPASQTTPISTV
jgi:hypothetical protein